MAPIFLLTLAFSVVVVLALLVGARRLDRRLRQIDPEAEVRELRATVEKLEQRIRHLEAIAAETPLDLPADAAPEAEAPRPLEQRRTRG